MDLLFRRNTLSYRRKQSDKVDSHIGADMLSASCFSLMAPVLEKKSQPVLGYFIAAIGIILGVLFLYLIDKFLPHLHVREKRRGRYQDRESEEDDKDVLI